MHTSRPVVAQPTSYLPVRFDGTARSHFALLDTGSQISLISRGLAAHLGLLGGIQEGSIRVRGFNGAQERCGVLSTGMALGRGAPFIQTELCVLPGDDYKLIVGHDLLLPMGYIIDSAASQLVLRDYPGIGELAIHLRDKDSAM